jgi:hypothetical protein
VETKSAKEPFSAISVVPDCHSPRRLFQSPLQLRLAEV